MYNDSYDDYIRNVLGNTEDVNYYSETRANSEIEECYPEIYGVVYPMVQKACRDIPETVTKDDVEKMVEELYGSLEGNDDINVNVTLNNNIDNSNSINIQQRPVRQPNRGTGLFKPNVEPKRESPLPPKVEPKETRYCSNGLCDIIRILLVRELLQGPNKPGPGPAPRPPYRPNPRPPFGPFPPFPPFYK